MKKAIFSAVVLAVMAVFVACKSASGYGSKVPYTVANRYFVRNDVSSYGTMIIDTMDKFERTFGMATTMGKDGKPTEINFEKQFVIAVTMGETEYDTDIKPVRLEKSSDGLVLTMNVVKQGEKRSYSITPCLILVVDKKYQDKVKFIGYPDE